MSHAACKVELFTWDVQWNEPLQTEQHSLSIVYRLNKRPYCQWYRWNRSNRCYDKKWSHLTVPLYSSIRQPQQDLRVCVCIYIYIYIYIYTQGPGSSVGIATGCGLDDPGSNPGEGRDFPSVQTGPGAHLACCKMGTGSFPRVKCGRSVLLTTHRILVPRSWKSRAIPLPTLWATPGL